MLRIKLESNFYISILIVTAAIMLSQGCKYENKEELFGMDEDCEFTNVSYAQTVEPLLDQNCYNCHSTSEASGGVILDTYDDAFSWADTGLLLCAIQHGDDCSNMPKNLPQMEDCDIEAIKTWIDEGIQNN